MQKYIAMRFLCVQRDPPPVPGVGARRVACAHDGVLVPGFVVVVVDINTLGVDEYHLEL